MKLTNEYVAGVLDFQGTFNLHTINRPGLVKPYHHGLFLMRTYKGTKNENILKKVINHLMSKHRIEFKEYDCNLKGDRQLYFRISEKKSLRKLITFMRTYCLNNSDRTGLTDVETWAFRKTKKELKEEAKKCHTHN